MPNYPVPGRGAWTLTGGLLPGKPGSTSKSGYYRLAASGEKPVGSAFANGSTSHHDQCVFLGVKAIQILAGVAPDGWFGPDTDKAVRAAQARWKVESDGIAGRATMRAGLTPLITQNAADYNIPVPVLGGLLVNESALDPAAVGVNGQDHGVAQINLGAHPSIALADAMSPHFAIDWTARDLAAVYTQWAGHTDADPWDVAIANHNNPALARKWAQTGVAPFVAGRELQIDQYVERVKRAW